MSVLGAVRVGEGMAKMRCSERVERGEWKKPYLRQLKTNEMRVSKRKRDGK